MYRSDDDDRVSAACDLIQRSLSRWPDPDFSLEVEMPLCILIERLGGQVWIDRHAYCKRDPEPVYHAAGFRTQEMREYYEKLPLVYAGEWIFIDPSDAQALVRDARAAL